MYLYLTSILSPTFIGLLYLNVVFIPFLSVLFIIKVVGLVVDEGFIIFPVHDSFEYDIAHNEFVLTVIVFTTVFPALSVTTTFNV